MNLILEIEFLTGVCRAARSPSDPTPNWPPQPDRVFSALVSAWGVRGELPDERAALEWLERQESPKIQASDQYARTAPDVYVPPNDVKILPDQRLGKARRFPVARPEDPNVELIWSKVPETTVLDSLNAVASCIGYIGHSSSLTRCRFSASNGKVTKRKPTLARRQIYPGRLVELEKAYHVRPEHPNISPGTPIVRQPRLEQRSSPDWLVLEVIGGEIPDIRASALVCRLLRQALMAGYRRAGQGDTIPEIVSGHTPDGTPTRKSHLSVVPMTFVGSRYADGHVLGFALIPPPGVSLLKLDGFRAAFETVAHYCTKMQRRVLSLQGMPLSGRLDLAPAPDNKDGKRSLSPDPYLMAARCWASVTPIVLDRHLKASRDDAEIRKLVANACTNAGLPQPDPEQILITKHSAVRGAPAAWPSRGEPPWTRWKVPKPLESRRLIHAVINFQQDLSGPVLIGAGRFTGLGLCRPMES